MDPQHGLGYLRSGYFPSPKESFLRFRIPMFSSRVVVIEQTDLQKELALKNRTLTMRLWFSQPRPKVELRRSVDPHDCGVFICKG
ncbi:MAG: hypothetical protein WCE23_01960 [Candidatus Binatus sp.]|uniref:hypothetical protein n=1 Tax=Candidatus Binatus sp. TaxID=2811406 RepID=UPI003C74BEAD